MLAAWRFLERDDPRTALPFGASMRRGVRHQAGAALDWPVGRRFFVRVDERLILFSRRDRSRDRLLNQTVMSDDAPLAPKDEIRQSRPPTVAQ